MRAARVLLAGLVGGMTGLALSGGAAAQDEPPGASLRVSLVTVAPGTAYASRFGHSFLRIRDEATGEDVAYTFGQSTFTRIGTLSRLLQGTAEVGAGTADPEEMFEHYRRQGRAIRIQHLALEPAERVRLREHLEGARGLFRYDFFRANCTTQLRDALDVALGGALRDATAGVPERATLREHAATFTRTSLPLHTAITLLMSARVDAAVSRWDGMYLPSTLRDGLREVRIEDGSGGGRALVEREERLGPDAPGSGAEAPDMAGPAAEGSAANAGSDGGLEPAPLAPYLLAGMGLGALLVVLGRRAALSREWRGAFGAVAGGWLLASGLAGVAIGGLWAVGQPLVAWNENLLQANPLALLVAVRAWGAAEGRGSARRWALAVAGISVLGLLLQLVPGFDQANGEILALFVPAQIGVAIGLHRAASPEVPSVRAASGARPLPG